MTNSDFLAPRSLLFRSNVIPIRSEESHKLMITKYLNFNDKDVLHLQDVGHLVQEVLQSKRSDVIGNEVKNLKLCGTMTCEILRCASE